MEHWTRRLYCKDRLTVLRRTGHRPEARRQRRISSSVWEEFTHPCTLHPLQEILHDQANDTLV
jgi:hypothetical protein